MFAAPLSAQRLIVTVSQGADGSNDRLAGATVCVGTAADRDQHGSKVTDSNGRAEFPLSLPGSQQVIVTAHKSGYAGRERTVTASSYDMHAFLGLQSGSGGLSCPATTPASGGQSTPLYPVVQATPQLSVSTFYIGGPGNPTAVQVNRSVPLHIVTTGVKPTHFRLSERQDFAGAPWRPSDGAQSHTFTTAGRRTLYLQTRFGANEASATLSNIASDVIDVGTFSTAGVTPTPVGSASGQRHRLECGGGAFIAAVTARSGLWLDAVGIRCPGGSVFGPVGGSGGSPITVVDVSECPAATAPGYVPVFRTPGLDKLRAGKLAGCAYLPEYGIAPMRAVAGTAGLGSSGPAECPANSLPVALDVYVDKLITGQQFVAGVGVVCAAPGSPR